MRVVALALLLCLFTPAHAQEAARIFNGVPIDWIEPAHQALSEFRTRRRDNIDCFVVSFEATENDGVLVSFSPEIVVAQDGEATLLSRTTTCGLGETFHYDANGRLIGHEYMRH